MIFAHLACFVISHGEGVPDAWGMFSVSACLKFIVITVNMHRCMFKTLITLVSLMKVGFFAPVTV